MTDEASPVRQTPAGLRPTTPSWATASPERVAHIERVARLVLDWAEEMGVPDSERNRWLRAVWLHALAEVKRHVHGPPVRNPRSAEAQQR